MARHEYDADANLAMIFKIKETILFDEKDGHIRVIKEQNRKPQQMMRKIGIKIPKRSYLELDDFGTFVFKQLDGVKTVKEIGELLAKHNEESATHLYERLLIYLYHLEVNEKWIELIN
ncbi:MAG: PqqD family protein [Streptococcaceae bacterium]|jgi:hypothetical protein|nr:PqqD family protein [Streptococcaceae bacterium]